MVSGCGGVCATWMNQGDDGNDEKCVPDFAQCGLTAASPRVQLLEGATQTMVHHWQPARDGVGGVSVMPGSVCGKMNGEERVRCLAWAFELAPAHRALQPYQISHALWLRPLRSSNACEYACSPPCASAAR